MSFPSGGYTSVSNARTDGLIHYWPINESSGEVVRDYGPFARHLDVLNDASNTSITTGVFSNTRELVSHSGSIAFESVPTTGSTEHTTEYSDITVSFWVNSDFSSMSSNFYILNLSTDNGNDSLKIVVDGTIGTDRLYFHAGSSSTYITASTYLTGADRHIFMTLSRTSSTTGTLNVYIDNTQVVTDYGYITVDDDASYFRPEFGWHIFMSFATGAQSTDLIGYVDDVCLWNRVLTSTERGYIYNSGTGTQVVQSMSESDLVGYFPTAGYTDLNHGEESDLVSYYPLDESSGTTFECFGPINKSGVVTNDSGDSTIVTGKFSNARDGVASGTGTTITLIAPEISGYTQEAYGLTISFWTNIDSADNSGTVTLFEMSSLQYSTTDVRIQYIGSSGVIQVSAGSFIQTSDVSSTLDGTWRHFFLKFKEESDGTQDAQIWLDNTQLTSGWSSTSTSKLFKPWYRATSICCSNSYQTDYHVDGAIDDLGIWLRPLSNEDKTRIYNSGTGVVLTQSTTYVRTVDETTSDSVALAETVLPPAVFGILLSELATITDYPYELGTTIYESISDQFDLSDLTTNVLDGTVEELVAEVFSTTDAASADVIFKLSDIIYLSGTVTPGQVLHLTLQDTARMYDALETIYQMLIQENLSTSDTVSIAYQLAELLSEYAVLNDTPIVAQTLGELVAVGLALTEANQLAFPKTLSELVTLQESISDSIASYMDIIEGVLFADLVTPYLSLTIPVTETLSTSDTLISTATVGNLLSDGFTFDVVFSDGDETYTGWVMNTRNLGVTQYSNYVFNSFAKVGSTYLAANSAGLYQLEGDDDAGVEIDAVIKTGKIDVGNGAQTRIEKAYLGLRSDGKILLKTMTGDQVERWYESPAPRTGVDTLRLTLGKGVKSRYWQFELNNIAGADFELDDIELLPVVLRRR